MANENNEKKSKMPVVDWVVAIAALVGFVICFFFWGCSLDLIVTILGIAVVLLGSTMLYVQSKKLAGQVDERSL